MRTLVVAAGLVLSLAVPQTSSAQPDSAPFRGDSFSPAALGEEEDPNFGPPIVIEKIEVVGNTSTAERIIRRVLPFREGEAMRAGDPRLRAARFKVLALGFFRDVLPIKLRKGSQRGYVIAVVEVIERGTIILNRIFFGNSLSTPWWAGLDLTERNLFGSGLEVGAAFVVTGEGKPEGGDSQKAFTLRVGDPSVLGSRVGVRGQLYHVDANEPFRVGGDPSEGKASNFNAFDYSRLGARAGASVSTSPISQFGFDLRLERVKATLPPLPTRVLPDGTSAPVELFLLPGSSRVVSLSASYDRDSRSDPVLTYAGDRFQAQGEIGSSLLGSDYDFGAVYAKYQRWWPVHGLDHVVSLHLTGGVVVGEAPLFERMHVGDLNRMVAPRALGLTVSTSSALDVFNTGADDVTYGEVGGVAEVQYSYRLFRRQRTVYGGDIFIGAGLWALAQRDNLRVRDGSLSKAVPIDLLLDIGLRLDTEIGIFELSLANGLGRLPL